MGEKHLEQIQQKIQEELLAELEQGMSFSDEEMSDEIELRVLKYGQIEYLTIEEKLELAKKIFNYRDYGQWSGAYFYRKGWEADGLREKIPKSQQAGGCDPADRVKGKPGRK